jgi:hypothetical protein
MELVPGSFRTDRWKHKKFAKPLQITQDRKQHNVLIFVHSDLFQPVTYFGQSH